jgi:hypothetical protein
MLTSIEGVYRNGHVELKEPPGNVPEETRVIVTFLQPADILLIEQGIDSAQAAELRASFATFHDWSSPEMSLYDHYDAAKPAR